MNSGRNSGKTQSNRADVTEMLNQLLGTSKGVTLGKMFGFPAFYANGKLFACVYGPGVGLKLPQAMVRDLEGKPGIAPFQPYGRAKMKEWIQISRRRATDYAADVPLFDASIGFVGGKAGQGRSASRSPSRRARAVRA